MIQEVKKMYHKSTSLEKNQDRGQILRTSEDLKSINDLVIAIKRMIDVRINLEESSPQGGKSTETVDLLIKIGKVQNVIMVVTEVETEIDLQDVGAEIDMEGHTVRSAHRNAIIAVRERAMRDIEEVMSERQPTRRGVKKRKRKRPSG